MRGVVTCLAHDLLHEQIVSARHVRFVHEVSAGTAFPQPAIVAARSWARLSVPTQLGAAGALPLLRNPNGTDVPQSNNNGTGVKKCEIVVLLCGRQRCVSAGCVR
ncbi:hypothetical protein ERJ75_000362100 [Trypanosoma vivax]|nr:hypothetical protein ERJ75_000362100 [Trypanosoma vivax]